MDNRTSEGQAAGVFAAGFTVGSLAWVGARCGTRGPRIKVRPDKELMKVLRYLPFPCGLNMSFRILC